MHTRDTRVFDAFAINIDLVPVILNLVHGISIEYSEDKRKIEKVLDWVAKATIGKKLNWKTFLLGKLLSARSFFFNAAHAERIIR